MRTLVLAALLLVGCSQADPCVTSSDCFSGETCNDGFCGAPQSALNAMSGDMPISDRDDGPGPGPDQGVPPGNDMSVATNNVTRPDLGTDPDGSTVVDDVCVVDPFGICEDDEDSNNNDFPGVAFATMTRGCQSSGFVPLDATVSGRQCALDPEDQYYLTVVECDADEPGMIIEATLDVKDDCDPALIWFDVESIGTSCADPNPDSNKLLRCETLVTGERKISIIWPGSSVPVVGSIRFSLQTPDRQDLQFDYDLRIVVREP